MDKYRDPIIQILLVAALISLVLAFIEHNFKYALFGKPNSISGNLVCELDPKYVEKGGKHVVEMTVTDGCGNRTTEQFDFVW